MKSTRRSKESALHVAAESGNPSRVEVLLEAGVEVDMLDFEGRSALHLASLAGSVQVVNMLLKHRADARVADTSGATPLHFAAREQHVEAVRLLLQAGSIVDAQDQNGNTPLSDAVFGYRGMGATIEALLAAGADPHMQNMHGVSPAELSLTIANYDVRRFFT